MTEKVKWSTFRLIINDKTHIGKTEKGYLYNCIDTNMCTYEKFVSK